MMRNNRKFVLDIDQGDLRKENDHATRNGVHRSEEETFGKRL